MCALVLWQKREIQWVVELFHFIGSASMVEPYQKTDILFLPVTFLNWILTFLCGFSPYFSISMRVLETLNLILSVLLKVSLDKYFFLLGGHIW